MRPDPYKQAEDAADRWTAALVWTVCIAGFVTWVAAVYVAVHFVHKYW